MTLLTNILKFFCKKAALELPEIRLLCPSDLEHGAWLHTSESNGNTDAFPALELIPSLQQWREWGAGASTDGEPTRTKRSGANSCIHVNDSLTRVARLCNGGRIHFPGKR